MCVCERDVCTCNYKRQNRLLLSPATAQQDAPPIPRDVGATELLRAVRGLQAHGPLTFLPGQVQHPARSMSSQPNTCPQDVPSEGGNVTHTPQGQLPTDPTQARLVHRAQTTWGKPQFPRAARYRQGQGEPRGLVRCRPENSLAGGAPDSRNPGHPSHKLVAGEALLTHPQPTTHILLSPATSSHVLICFLHHHNSTSDISQGCPYFAAWQRRRPPSMWHGTASDPLRRRCWDSLVQLSFRPSLTPAKALRGHPATCSHVFNTY